MTLRELECQLQTEGPVNFIFIENSYIIGDICGDSLSSMVLILESHRAALAYKLLSMPLHPLDWAIAFLIAYTTGFQTIPSNHVDFSSDRSLLFHHLPSTLLSFLPCWCLVWLRLREMLLKQRRWLLNSQSSMLRGHSLDKMIQLPLPNKPLNLNVKLVAVFSIVTMVTMIKAVSIQIPMAF